jgi:hypothetical protein
MMRVWYLFSKKLNLRSASSPDRHPAAPRRAGMRGWEKGSRGYGVATEETEPAERSALLHGSTHGLHKSSLDDVFVGG